MFVNHAVVPFPLGRGHHISIGSTSGPMGSSKAIANTVFTRAREGQNLGGLLPDLNLQLCLGQSKPDIIFD